MVLAFVTNVCPHLCPRCLTASGPRNRNSLGPSDFAGVRDDFIHLCGGEPLVNSAIGDVMETIFSQNNDCLLYTSLPYDFDRAVLHMAEDWPRLKFRLSTSEYLLEHNPGHVVRTCQVYRYLKNLGRDVGISGYDRTVEYFPQSYGAVRTPSSLSGRCKKIPDDPYDVGPKMDVIYSDGTRGEERLIRAHYLEAQKSVHLTSSS